MNNSQTHVDWHQQLKIQFLADEPPQLVRLGEAFNFAQNTFAQGFAQQGESILYQILHHNPKLAPVYQFYLSLLKQQGRVTDQANLCREWLKHDPQNLSARMSQVEALRDQGDTTGAITVCVLAVKQEPNNIELLNHLGVLHKEQGNLTQALAVFNQCPSRAPTFVQTYWNRADLLPILPIVN